jgi:hypothetical protein
MRTAARIVDGSFDLVAALKQIAKLVHSPTGATFWLGDKDVALCDTGVPDLASGHDYEIDELKNEAWRIMVARKAGM